MLDYSSYFKQVIARKDFTLSEMEDKINKCWLDGKLSESDRDELMQLAADNARDELQVDVIAKLAELEQRVAALEHPEPEYPIWEPGYTTHQHEIVRYDVTGDGEYDLCQYNGGRSYTSLSIGKIEGWNMLDRELNPTHVITRDASGGYVITPINDEPAEEPEEEGEE